VSLTRSRSTPNAAFIQERSSALAASWRATSPSMRPQLRSLTRRIVQLEHLGRLLLAGVGKPPDLLVARQVVPGRPSDRRHPRVGERRLRMEGRVGDEQDVGGDVAEVVWAPAALGVAHLLVGQRPEPVELRGQRHGVETGGEEVHHGLVIPAGHLVGPLEAQHRQLSRGRLLRAPRALGGLRGAGPAARSGQGTSKRLAVSPGVDGVEIRDVAGRLRRSRGRRDHRSSDGPQQRRTGDHRADRSSDAASSHGASA